MIRKATLDDIPVLMEIASVVFPVSFKEILSPEQIEYMMDMMYSQRSLTKQMTEKGIVYFLFYDEKNLSKPLGYVSIFEDKPKVFHLDKIYVMPDVQKTGVGKILFCHAVNECKVRGGIRMELNVNRHNVALNFYRLMGMNIQRQEDFPIGNGYYMNDYIMELDLTK